MVSKSNIARLIERAAITALRPDVPIDAVELMASLIGVIDLLDEERDRNDRAMRALAETRRQAFA